jgi:glycosyltransferase involved in cell wall biosynthesis
MSEEKIKVLTISDMPLGTSGVGLQTRAFIEALLKTGRFKVISLGGAIKHKSYKPIKTEEYGDDFVVHPVNGFGDEGTIRSILRNEKPDVVWIMTDPRFFEWLWAMENEIRSLAPLVYYHVWDNYPYPNYNKPWYDSNDKIVCISKLTADVVKNVSPTVDSEYLPHAVNNEVFKPFESEVTEKLREENFTDGKDKVVFFWNNRNAKRKLAASIIHWFKDFLDRVGEDKAILLMHTNPKDPHGPDLEAVAANLDLNRGQVLFSTTKLPEHELAAMYNIVDCTVNISDAEGFGLGTLESLSCGTPIIVNMTGGLQEQVTDGQEEFGIPLQPASKAIIGSQNVPYIYEDRVDGKDFVNALEKIYKMSKEERKEMGLKGRKHVLTNYSFEKYQSRWVEIIDEVHQKWGSWEDKKQNKLWTMEVV